jgi:hypothetical protein
MSDSSLFSGNPENSVQEVNPDDLRAFWNAIHSVREKFGDQRVGFDAKYIEQLCKPGTDPGAIWQRTSMIFVLQKVATEKMAPLEKGEGFNDAVFEIMATIPMKQLGHIEQPLPFDVDDFFRQVQYRNSGI